MSEEMSEVKLDSVDRFEQNLERNRDNSQSNVLQPSTKLVDLQDNLICMH